MSLGIKCSSVNVDIITCEIIPVLSEECLVIQLISSSHAQSKQIAIY